MKRTMYCYLVAAIAGLVTGTTFISSVEEGILKAVPSVTSQLLKDPTPLLDIAPASDIVTFFSGPCVYGYKPSPPWWVFDLGEEMKVMSISVKNTGSCCDPWLGNFTVEVGNRLSADNEMYGSEVCVKQSGKVPPNVTVSHPCVTPVRGQYVKLTSKCVDLFGSVLSCDLHVHAVPSLTPGRKSAVFTQYQKSAPEGGYDLGCARQCMGEDTCVRFSVSSSGQCVLYDRQQNAADEGYSLSHISL
ncbi:fucolectin-4-like [Haliotis rufescens]|uniref:fucolectin-4-like n=1 Tax=Haliotis rufescens TaxID=6454 RepID=UPI001EB04597|nr:fucolectin-4-like [Haliotis rufescens]